MGNITLFLNIQVPLSMDLSKYPFESHEHPSLVLVLQWVLHFYGQKKKRLPFRCIFPRFIHLKLTRRINSLTQNEAIFFFFFFEAIIFSYFFVLFLFMTTYIVLIFL